MRVKRVVGEVIGVVVDLVIVLFGIGLGVVIVAGVGRLWGYW